MQHQLDSLTYLHLLREVKGHDRGQDLRALFHCFGHFASRSQISQSREATDLFQLPQNDQVEGLSKRGRLRSYLLVDDR